MPKEDIEIREFLKKKLKNTSMGRVATERPAKNAHITIYSSCPGVVTGKKGEDIELLKAGPRHRMGMPVHVSIEKIREPEVDVQLIIDSITQQPGRRIMFRRVMKCAMQGAMCLGAQGVRIMNSGRLNGVGIARTEQYRGDRVPLHMLRAGIDYGFSGAGTTYDIIGVKVWVYKGGRLGHNDAPIAEEPQEERRKRPSCPEDRRREGKGCPTGQCHGAGAGVHCGADAKTGE